MARSTDTLTQLLDIAERLCQERGYNAFSYHDLAALVGIKTASVHYHFPTKADLGKAMVVRYRQRFAEARKSIDDMPAEPDKKLARYAGLLKTALKKEKRMCLCGILAAESATLPPALLEQVRGFFVENETWLAGQLKAGQQAGLWKLRLSAPATAKSIFAGLEGAMMTARALDDTSRLDDAVDFAMSGLTK